MEPSSVLQSTLWPSAPSTRRMPLILLPFLSTVDEPLTLRSLTRITASPSASALPLASRTMPSPAAASPASSSACMGHSKRSEEQTSELQSPDHLVCPLLLEKKKNEK